MTIEDMPDMQVVSTNLTNEVGLWLGLVSGIPLRDLTVLYEILVYYIIYYQEGQRSTLYLFG